MIEAGNIDLDHRPIVHNPDGSISTISSIGVNLDGAEVLLPSISPEGRRLSTQDAIEQYKRTGQHLGKFQTPDEATAYAKQLSARQGRFAPPRMPTLNDLRAIQDALVNTDPQDVETIDLLKEQYSRASAGLAAAQPRAPTAPGAAGAPTRGGSTGTLEDIPDLRTVGAVAATAPAKGLTGVADAARMATRKAPLIGREALGLTDPKEPFEALTPKVDALADELAGKPVGRSKGRAAFEGAIMAPLSGAKMAALPSAALSGAAAGGAGEWAREKDLPWWAQLGAGVVAGGVAGTAANAFRMRPSELASRGRLTESVKGVTEEELRKASKNLASAKEVGLDLMPSQGLDAGEAGLVKLQSALMDSKAGGSEEFLRKATQVPGRVRELVEQLKNRGGQTPRDEALLADEIQKVAIGDVKSGSKAVNEATKPLYQSIEAQKPMTASYAAYRLKQANDIIDEALLKYRSEAGTPEALEGARRQLTKVLGSADKKPVTPEELHNALANIRRSLPEYDAMATSTANRARENVTQTLAYLQQHVDNLAPSLRSAREMQGELRSNLPGKFDEMTRLAKRGGGPGSALDFAAGEPEVVGAVGKAQARLAQELLQHRVNKAAGKALDSTRPGESVHRSLRDLPEPELMFTGSADAAGEAGKLRQTLEALRMGDRPTGRATANDATFSPLGAQSTTREATRGAMGQVDYALGTVGRMAASAGLRISDAAAIKVLSQPDALDRLAYLKSLPPSRVTRAALLASFPGLFQENEK